MARRGLEEIALQRALERRGFTLPSMTVQSSAFPGVSASANGEGGRSAVIFDIARIGNVGGIKVEAVASLKASGKERKSTISWTTGTARHVGAVLDGAISGFALPLLSIYLPNARIVEGEILDAPHIEVAVVNVGDAIRTTCPTGDIPLRTQGQGRGRGMAIPVARGHKKQKAASGVVYEYHEIQVNIAACGAEYVRLDSLEALYTLIGNTLEGIPI